MSSKKTLEINPYHPIIMELAKQSKDNGDKPEESTKEHAWVLYDLSLTTAGFNIDVQLSNVLAKSGGETTSLYSGLFFLVNVPTVSNIAFELSAKRMACMTGRRRLISARRMSFCIIAFVFV